MWYHFKKTPKSSVYFLTPTYILQKEKKRNDYLSLVKII
jgi:hypothetical protein